MGVATSIRIVSFAASAFVLLGLQTSCSTANKKEKGEVSPLLSRLGGGEKITDEQIENLKKIANDPINMLPPAEEDTDDGELAEALPEFVEPPIPETEEPIDYVKEWSAPGLNPVAVNPGDIFSENAGPVLKKSLSLSDSLDESSRTQVLAQVASSDTKRVPITISQRELNALYEKTGSDVPLPTRSVALDFKTNSLSVDPKRYELFLEKLATGDTGGAINSREVRQKIQNQLREVKKRLKAGEELFVITGVTETDRLLAHYPGAPLGRRDAEPIRNALQVLYPHLIDLNATKVDSKIELTGSPRILWEFEARGLKLSNGNVVIEEESLARL